MVGSRPARRCRIPGAAIIATSLSWANDVPLRLPTAYLEI